MRPIPGSPHSSHRAREDPSGWFFQPRRGSPQAKRPGQLHFDKAVHASNGLPTAARERASVHRDLAPDIDAELRAHFKVGDDTDALLEHLEKTFLIDGGPGDETWDPENNRVEFLIEWGIVKYNSSLRWATDEQREHIRRIKYGGKHD